MMNQIPAPTLYKNSGLRSKIRVFVWLIIIATLSIPLLAIALYAVNVDDTIYCRGTVIPEHTYDLTAPFGGRVATIFFKTGAKVKAGDLIVKLDDSDFRNNARQTEAALAILQAELQVKKSALEALKIDPLPEVYRHAEPRLEAAEIAYNKAVENESRYREVLTKIEFLKYEKDTRDAKVELAVRKENARIVREGLGKKLIEKAENEIHVIERQIDEKRVAIDILRKQIRDCEIRSSVDGTILEIPCKRAMFAEKGEPAVSIGSLDLMVLAEVDAHFIRKVRLFQDAEINSEIYSRLQYGNFKAVVEKISEVPLDNTTLYPVYLRLNTEGVDFKIGSKSEVRIITGSSPAIYAFLNISQDDATAKRLQENRKRLKQEQKKAKQIEKQEQKKAEQSEKNDK